MNFKYVLKFYVFMVIKNVMKFNLLVFEEENQVENINKYKCKIFFFVMGFIILMFEFQYYVCNIVNMIMFVNLNYFELICIKQIIY